jgi:hypothetical protein
MTRNVMIKRTIIAAIDFDVFIVLGPFTSAEQAAEIHFI